MNKNIVIIGGGISGLSVLHFLKKKYAGRSDVRIRLLEKNAGIGGTIATTIRDGCLFESGPNGFLANQDATLELIHDLGLDAQVISANESAKKRFVLVDGKLHQFPMSPAALFGFKPMRFLEKLRVFAEPFIFKGEEENETVFDFACRRFGSAVARYFTDPMVSGIYGGDSDFLSVRAAFPKLYAWEQKYGSVMIGMIRSRGKHKLKAGLKSFRSGMGQLVGVLAEKYHDAIQTGEEVKSVLRAGEGFVVVTSNDKYAADELFLAAPAYVAGELLGTLNADLGQALCSIDYAPIAVFGLVYERSVFKKLPQGFGYLIPSSEETPILGVLIESQVYEGRASADKVLIRVMIGGSRYPEYIKKSKDDLLQLARQEVEKRFDGFMPPAEHFFVSYAKAIPQYETQYPVLKKRIASGLAAFPHLHLTANYWNGVSMNDCVANAKNVVERLNI